MQKLIVTGYVGRDAKVATFQDGTNAINFSLAESQKFVDKETGEIKEKTTWFDCSYYRRPGQSVEVAQYLKPGTLILVTGKVTATTYTNKNGKVLPALRLYVNELELLSSAKDKPTENSQKQPETAENS